MARIIALSISLLLIASCLGACTPAVPAEEEPSTTLVVFAAASLTESLTEIAHLYRGEHPDIDLKFQFDSSGTLRTQILEGAECDLFFSAGKRQMDDVGEELLLRIDLLENTVCLAVPHDNPAGLTSFERFVHVFTTQDVLLSMGHSDVPVGQYASQILDYLELDEPRLASRGRISYASNVKEIVSHLGESAVEAGFVYTTDATAAGLEVIAVATPEMCDRPRYPAAVLSRSSAPEEAQAFLQFLSGEKATDVFKAAGFLPAED